MYEQEDGLDGLDSSHTLAGPMSRIGIGATTLSINMYMYKGP
jgi:hypothetical protein